MIKRLFVTCLIVLLSTVIFANPVSSNFAQTIATNWYKQFASTRTNDFTITDVVETKYQGLTTYYIFIFNAGGFVMVSADDATTPILGYSIDEPFDKNNIPPNAQDFFTSYSREIFQIVNAHLSNQVTSLEWNDIFRESYQRDIMAVAPLCSTTWNQSPYYNALCPGAGPDPTGCVATAMAQVMKKWAYPTTGQGTHSYIPGTHPTYGTLTANFGATTYNWAGMPNNVTSSNTSVATLMYHCGVSVNMDYDAAGSGAYMSDVPYSLINYFKYQPSAETKYQSLYPTENLWTAMIKAEMDAGRPVILAGSSAASGGHAFVCDGYNTANKYHINWGWGGLSNGYFFLNALNPSGSNFSESRQAVVRITPLNNNAPIANFSADNTIPAINAPVSFTDQSLHTPTSWLWTFEGGTPSTSSAQNPTGITFATNGYKVISLTVTNASGSDVVYKERYIKVGGIPSAWTKQNTGFSNSSRGIDQIFIVDPNIVWAKAYDGANPTGYIREFTRTNNGGTTWIPGSITFTNSANYGVSNIFAFSYTTAYACMFPISGTGGAIVKTTDGGATWAVQSTAPFTNSWADFVHFFDANNGVCMGDPTATTASDFVIYTTSNGGTTWTQVATSSLPNSLANEAGIVNLYDAVGDTIWFSTNKGRMYKSVNKGLAWTVGTTGFTNTFTMKFKNGNTGIAVLDTLPYTIKKTTNGGTTWTTITPTGYLVNYPRLAYLPGTASTWVDVSASPNTGSSYSLNDCASFLNVDTGSVMYTSVSFFNSSAGWAGSFNNSSTDGGIYKWNSSILAGTINVSPSATVCQGTNVTLTAPSGTSYLWSTGATTASINVAATGTYSVTVTDNMGGTSSPTPVTITVNSLPTISGTQAVCAGATTTLTGTPAGGTWSSGTPANATITSGGVVTGVAAGTSVITYTGGGCSNTTTVTVNALPAISGTQTVCTGVTTTLTGTPAGGTWSSGTPANATITSGGVVSGVAAGTSVITYTAGGCSNTSIVTVNAIPSISGVLSVCAGATTSLTGAPTGGTWSSGSPAIATINTGGVITGVSAGTSVVTYISGGCSNTSTVTVNALPSISGTQAVCLGATTTLTGAPTGGTWSSATPANATIDAGGVVTGVSAGTSVITYTGGGCSNTTTVTVNALPTINGTLSVCEGSTTALTGAPTGGTWSSGSLSNATIDAGGIVSGVAAGTSVITYTGGGCTNTTTVTVNAIPATPVITLNGFDLSSDAATGNQWYNSAGAINGATAQAYTATADDGYYVIVTANGCSSAQSNIINVIGTGIEQGKSQSCEFILYPNPVKSELTVESHAIGNTTIEISDVMGQVLYTSILESTQTIDMTYFANSLYIIKVSTETGSTVKRFVKQ